MTLSALGIFSAAGAGGAAAGAYELISTTVLGTSTASVTFSSLGDYSSTYKHLQIRSVVRTNRADTLDEVNLRFNGDSSALSTSLRVLQGNAGGISAGGAGGQNRILLSYTPAANNTANAFATFVADILDPFSTTKNKTVRSFGGQVDGSFTISALYGGAWYNTSSVTSIALTCNASFITGSRFSLYGIKG